MAEASRLADDPRLERLFRDPSAVGFFELLELFERLAEQSLGRAEDPRGDPFRLRPSPSLGFPTSDVLDVEARADDGRILVTTGFAGLYGVSSPLPSTYVDHWAHAASERSGRRVLAFLDVLHHRVGSLLHRGHRRSLVSSLDPHDELLGRLLSIAGAPRATRDADASASSTPSLARWFIHRHRSAALLRAALSERLGREVEVEELCPRRLVIPPGQRTRLGARPSTSGVHAANVLGDSFVLGRGVVARTGITIKTTARAAEDLTAFAAGGHLHREAARVVAAFGDTTEPRLELRIPESLAPRPVLYGPRGGRETHAALGRTAWLGGARAGARVMSVRLDQV